MIPEIESALLVVVTATLVSSCSGRSTARLEAPATREPLTAALSPMSTDNLIELPPPRQQGSLSLEEVLTRRRSVREFSAEPLSLAEVGQLLWAAQGITGEGGLRTAPSAGARYPLELYVITREGVSHYEQARHRLQVLMREDRRPALYAAALDQDAVLQAPAVIAIAAVYERTTHRYGSVRGERYVHLEAGHAVENLLLQSTALGLGAVPIGAFDDDQVSRVLALGQDHRPVYLIPVGHELTGDVLEQRGGNR